MPSPARHRFTELDPVPVRFRLGSFAVTWRGWGFIPPSRWSNQLHEHAYFEICYAFAGRGRFLMLGQEHEVRRGEVFVARPREEHRIISGSEERLGIYFWSYLLEPTRAEAESEVDRLLADFIASRRWISPRVPGMERTLELLTEEAARAEPGNGAAVAGLAAKLVLDAARAVVGEPRRASDGARRDEPPEKLLVERARGFIHDNLSRPLGVRDIAVQVGLSERHLSRLFQRLVGRSPMAYLSSCRVESAGRLLLQGIAIKEVAARLGFGDVRYFTTVFRSATGQPPAAFRAAGGTRQIRRGRG